MALKWREVAEKEEYKALPDADKAKAKIAYFYDVVAPNVPEEQVKAVRSSFLNDTARLEIDKAKPSFIKEVVGKSILKLPQRVAGIAIGAMNSPLSFAWSSMSAP